MEFERRQVPRALDRGDCQFGAGVVEEFDRGKGRVLIGCDIPDSVREAHPGAVPQAKGTFVMTCYQIVAIIRDVHAVNGVLAQSLVEKRPVLLLGADVEDLDVARRVANEGECAALMSEQLDTFWCTEVLILFFDVKFVT